MKRPWTKDDDAVMRKSYGKAHISALVASLDRTERSIHHRARKLHLVRPRRAYGSTTVNAARIRKLNAAGYTDPEIAKETGLGVKAICCYRKRHGIPSNRWGERHRRRNADANAGILARNGVGSFHELKEMSHRCRKAAQGWPIDLPAPCIRILEALVDLGPQTSDSLAVALGYTSREAFYPGKRRPGYLQVLRERGIIRSRRDPDAPKGSCRMVHELAPGVRPGPALAMGDDAARCPAEPKCFPTYVPTVHRSHAPGGIR